jgi:hypothetical protein
LLIKSGSLFFRFSLFVSFWWGLCSSFFLCLRLSLRSVPRSFFFFFFLPLRGSLLRSPLRFLFLAPSFLFFLRALFPRSFFFARCSSLAFALAVFSFVLFRAFVSSRSLSSVSFRARFVPVCFRARFSLALALLGSALVFVL